jgi:hypothetical protein
MYGSHERGGFCDMREPSPNKRAERDAESDGDYFSSDPCSSCLLIVYSAVIFFTMAQHADDGGPWFLVLLPLGQIDRTDRHHFGAGEINDGVKKEQLHRRHKQAAFTK